ncbi:MAG: sensor histidine kinase, partial [Flavobacteriales bacterium]
MLSIIMFNKQDSKSIRNQLIQFAKTKLIIFSVLFSPSLLSQSLILESEVNSINLKPYIQYFKTENPDLEYNKILNSEWKTSWNGGNFGIVRYIYWIKIDINNVSNKTIKSNFYIPYHHLSSIEFYQYQKDTLKWLKTEGTIHSYENKKPKNPGYIVNLEFEKGESSIILKANHLNMPLRVNSFLVSQSKTEKLLKNTSTLSKIWKVIIISALFLSVLVFFFTKIKLFLYYSIMNFGVILFIAPEIGEYFLFFDQDKFKHLIDIKYFGTFFILLGFPKFLDVLTPTKFGEKLWKIIYLTLTIYCIFLIPTFFQYFKNSILTFISGYIVILSTALIFTIQLYVVTIALIKKGRNSVSLFTIYLVYIVSASVDVILPNLGLMSDKINSNHLLIYSSIIEIIVFMALMGFELANIYKDRNSLMEKKNNHQKLVLNAMIKSQENERNKIGEELDKLIVDNIRTIKKKIKQQNNPAIKILDDTIDSVRSLSHGLMTPKVEGDQLKDEIIDLCLLSSNDSFKANYYFHEWEPLKNKENSTHLYRIVQELLQNTIKHSEANEAYLQIIRNDEKVTLLFEDNG